MPLLQQINDPLFFVLKRVEKMRRIGEVANATVEFRENTYCTVNEYRRLKHMVHALITRNIQNGVKYEDQA